MANNRPSTNTSPLRDLDIEWMDDAACFGMDPDLFFAPPPARGNGDWDLAPREMCRSCPVQMECLDYATVNNLFGIWGGSGEDQRQFLRRKRNEGSPPHGCRKCGSRLTGPRRKADPTLRMCIACGHQFKIVIGGRPPKGK